MISIRILLPDSDFIADACIIVLVLVGEIVLEEQTWFFLFETELLTVDKSLATQAKRSRTFPTPWRLCRLIFPIV